MTDHEIFRKYAGIGGTIPAIITEFIRKIQFMGRKSGQEAGMERRYCFF